MNLFRSEEHVRNWNGFKPGTEEGIVELPLLLKLFSLRLFTKRLDADYVSRFPEYAGEAIAAFSEVGKTKPFWTPRDGVGPS
jgi:hypothetical protein